MSTEPAVDWMETAITDLEARKAKIDAAIATIRELQGQSIPTIGGGPGGGRPNAFLGMSIPDAAKKHLETTRQKQSTREIMDAIEKGGLPPSKYNTVYSVLRRRESDVGDIINFKGDWALKEWYPNYRPGKGKGGKGSEEMKDEGSTEETPAITEVSA